MRVVGDEHLSSKPIVRMPSLADNGSMEEVTVQTHPTIFILPGVEGALVVKFSNSRKF